MQQALASEHSAHEHELVGTVYEMIACCTAGQ